MNLSAPISYQEALDLTASQAPLLNPTEASLQDALLAVLAEDITASFPSPRFDNSRMDGYAVRSKDLNLASSSLPTALRVAGESRAGWEPKYDADISHSCIRVSTGAPVPADFDAVVMQEETVLDGSSVLFAHPVQPGQNIRKTGEDYKSGQILAKQGTRLDPGWISLLASAGIKNVKIRKPSAAIVLTGDEVGGSGPYSLFDANGPGITAILHSLGISPVPVFRAGDTPELVREAIEAAHKAADLVIVSGGISVGPHDHVRQAMLDLGFSQVFWRVRVKPGQPTCLGTMADQGKCILALPGNPVSALTMMLAIGLPLLMQITGWKTEAADRGLTVPARLKVPVSPSARRYEFVRGVGTQSEDGLLVEPLTARESHQITGFAGANVLIHLPENSETLPAGAHVRVQVIPGASQLLI